MNEIVMVGEGSRAQQTKLSFTTVLPSVQLHCKVMDKHLFKGWGFLIDAILRIFLLMIICTLLQMLLVFCFPPPNSSNCFERLSRRDPERSWFLFLGWFKLVSLFMLVRIIFCQQVQWLPRWLNLRCWSRVWIEVLVSWLRTLLVGLKRLVGYGWKVIVEWDWFCCGWRWLIVLLLLRRRVVWGWKSVWGWEIGCLGLRDGLVGVERLVGWGW